MRSLLVFALLCLLLGGSAAAGVLAPGLSAQLEGMTDDEVVRVLVVMRDRVDLPALDRELRAQKAASGERHRRVLAALQDVAAASQGDLLATLGADKARGRVLGYSPHWLVNGVVVSATVGAVRELARHPDVERVEADLVAELIEPLASPKKVAAGKAAAGNGTAPGVAAVNAPRVWQELGIDGTGVVVGILDTGVDGFHPALASRWRGTAAPAAECWLDASGLGDTDFPVDRHYHGTHVMGILTGQAPGDTIGVAPGARWIAANVINHPGPLDVFDNAVIASLEFMADPDGDPTTTADVPAVVHNSWGVSAAFEEYFACDSRWWDAIDALEAAGVVVTWSAGNEGPNPGTLRSPADRASSPLNAFSVGSTSAFPPYAVSSFSSRGPSLCGGPDQVKPEIVAPGSNIYSAQPGGRYQYLSGTSMAGPHVAGVVALMRAASPQADVAAIKQALLDTAVDLPPAGEDNGSGWGLVDAYAAVMAVKSGVGEITGTVTGRDSGLPVAGAAVQLQDGLHAAVTDETGAYRIVLPAGPAVFTVTAFGFTDGRLDVTIADGGIEPGDIVLADRPRAAVHGRVTGPAGEPVPGAAITADGAPLEPAISDAAGDYALELPAGAGLSYTVRARAAGYGSARAVVAVDGPVALDFALPPAAVEDFESAGFASYPWVHGGDAAWTIDGAVAWEGSFSARAGAPGGNGISRMELRYDVLDPEDLVFRYRVSSEPGYDFLRFYVDGVLQAAWSGDLPWTEHRQALAAGTHTLAWSYEKDESVAVGADAGWIDMIEFPSAATAARPAADVQPPALALTAPPGQGAAGSLLVVNAGDAVLEFGVTTSALPPGGFKSAVAVPHGAAAKTAVDARPAVVRTTGGGGPDRFGYRWRDNDDPLGPTYTWIDIAEDGAPVPLGDDDNLGPFALGFPFPFYGEEFDQVRIAANGFLSFSATSGDWANQGLPDPAEPNHLLAAFWDDLSPNLGGTVLRRAEPGRFIVQFQDVPHFGAPGVTETFQVILTADGAVTYQYAAVGDDGGCTVGIENGAGDDGLLVQFNAAGSLQADTAIRFRAEPPPPWLTVAPAGGTVPAAGQQALTVAVDAAGLPPGNYQAFINVVTNDPDRSAFTVPVNLVVRELAGPTPELPRAVVLVGAVPNPFNPATEIRFALPRAAAVSLNIYDVAGRLVRELVRGSLPDGTHGVRWDGRDDDGRGVASGTYVARLVVDGVPHARSLTLLR